MKTSMIAIVAAVAGLTVGPALAQNQTTAPANPQTPPPAVTAPAPADTGTGMGAAGDTARSTAPAMGAGGEAFIATQGTDQFLGTDLVGATVRSAANEDIGDVNDVLFDDTGRGVAVVVGVGGFLGIGEKNVAVPFERLTITREDGNADELQVSLDTTREELNAAPDFRAADDGSNTSATEGVVPNTNATGSTTGGGMGTGTGTGTGTGNTNQ